MRQQFPLNLLKLQNLGSCVFRWFLPRAENMFFAPITRRGFDIKIRFQYRKIGHSIVCEKAPRDNAEISNADNAAWIFIIKIRFFFFNTLATIGKSATNSNDEWLRTLLAGQKKSHRPKIRNDTAILWISIVSEFYTHPGVLIFQVSTLPFCLAYFVRPYEFCNFVLFRVYYTRSVRDTNIWPRLSV